MCYFYRVKKVLGFQEQWKEPITIILSGVLALF